MTCVYENAYGWSGEKIDVLEGGLLANKFDIVASIISFQTVFPVEYSSII